MSRLVMGISGALALTLMSGAAELARGRDLSSLSGAAVPQAHSLGASIEAVTPVNRSSKADRASAPVGSPASTRTVALKLESFSDTTFLVRMPVATASSPAIAVPAKSPAAARRPMVACEPVVSFLTDVAKRLDPGRCVT